MIQGENGSGKTSLLEAIAYASVLKSFRTTQKDSLIRAGSERAEVACDLLEGERRIEIRLRIDPVRKDQTVLNGQRLQAARELAEVLRTTLFTPDDLALVKGPPAGRRDLLDDAVFATSARRAATRAELERILRQRNALLRQVGGRLRPDTELSLDVWDERLAEVGEEVAATRAELTEALSPYAKEAFGTLAPDAGPLELRYERSFSLPLLEALRAHREEDLRRQLTLTGPQRDELAVSAGGLDARTRLSQGRQRCVALALRLATHRYVAEVTGRLPLLLLDDAFSELDERTGRALMAELPAGQALLTTAGRLPPGASPASVVRLQNGAIL